MLVGVALLAAGCQTSGKGGYSETVQGDYNTLASCFAGQPVEAQQQSSELNLDLDDDDDDDDQEVQQLLVRRITLNDPASRTVVVDVGTSSGTGYRVTFTGITESTTEVRTRPVGNPPRYFWPNIVVPQVARCSGRIRS